MENAFFVLFSGVLAKYGCLDFPTSRESYTCDDEVTVSGGKNAQPGTPAYFSDTVIHCFTHMVGLNNTGFWHFHGNQCSFS